MEENQKPAKIWKRKNIHLVSEENDIKFRGPLSYRHLRILGWLFLAISQVGVLLGIGVNMKMITVSESLLTVLKAANNLMAPLFLLAAFAQVLVAKDGYRRLITAYLLGALGLFGLFLIIYFHFAIGLLTPVAGSWGDAKQVVDIFFTAINANGTFSFNIFIDLILCALVTFFLNYRPTKFFQGKKIYIFRWMVLLPILYEAGSITLKLLASNGQIIIPPLVLPLLTTKPPVAFLIFIALAWFVKHRERYYIKKGRTHEDYKTFLHTNVNRLHFSITLASTILLAVVIDIALMVLIFAVKFSAVPDGLDPETTTAYALAALQSTIKMGFGGCVPMLLIIPVVLFFDYTKTYKNKMMDIVIPVAGIALIAIIYVEGLFIVLKNYLADLVSKVENLGEDESNPEGLMVAAGRYIKNIFHKK